MGEVAPDPYSTPSAGVALAPKDESYMSPAIAPESDMPTASQVTILAMPPLQYGPEPGPTGRYLYLPLHAFIPLLRRCNATAHTGVKIAAMVQLVSGE